MTLRALGISPGGRCRPARGARVYAAQRKPLVDLVDERDGLVVDQRCGAGRALSVTARNGVLLAPDFVQQREVKSV